MTDWARVPKVELHLHLEGAAPRAFIRQLAADKGIDLTSVFDEDGNYAWTDFAHFLRIYEAACAVLRGPDDYRLAKSAGDGVIYTEIFLAPDRTPADFRAMNLTAAAAAFCDEATRAGIVARLTGDAA